MSPSRLEKDLENKSVIRRGVQKPRSKTSNRKLGEKTLKTEQSKSLPGPAASGPAPAPAAERPLHDAAAEHESRAPQTQLIVGTFVFECPRLRRTDFREIPDKPLTFLQVKAAAHRPPRSHFQGGLCPLHDAAGIVFSERFQVSAEGPRRQQRYSPTKALKPSCTPK